MLSLDEHDSCFFGTTHFEYTDIAINGFALCNGNPKLNRMYSYSEDIFYVVMFQQKLARFSLMGS